MTYREPIVCVGQARSVISEVAEKHGIDPEHILAETRGSKTAIRARQEVFARLHDMGASFMSIARLMDRDHSTVMHGVRQHRERASC